MVPDATRRELTESPHILIEYRRHFSASTKQTRTKYQYKFHRRRQTESGILEKG
jgi:hypothetical protein